MIFSSLITDRVKCINEKCKDIKVTGYDIVYDIFFLIVVLIMLVIMFYIFSIILKYAWNNSITSLFGIREISSSESFWLLIVFVILIK